MDNTKAENTPKIGSVAKVTRVNHGIPALPSRKKVAAYARVSVDSEELMASLAAQVSHYSAYIQANPSWEYAGVYADAGISVFCQEKLDKMVVGIPYSGTVRKYSLLPIFQWHPSLS